MLEKEIKYFYENQNDLYKQYPGQYLVIKNQKVIRVYDNKIDAYLETEPDHEVGSFLVQFCSLDKEIFIQSFTPNSMIA